MGGEGEAKRLKKFPITIKKELKVISKTSKKHLECRRQHSLGVALPYSSY